MSWAAIAGILVVLNAASFVLFWFDKRRARRGGRRISERALLTSALISGTIGAWAAMSLFRHKTRKSSFIARMVAVTVLDAALLIALVVL